MNAQKLNNNKIAISNIAPRKDAIQIIENLGVADFYLLTKAARNWDKSLNDNRDIMFTTYENEQSKVCKEFDRIYQRRELIKERNAQLNNVLNIIPNVEESINTPFKLVKFPKNKIIRLCKRGSSKKNYKNTLLITENEMKQFSRDAKRYNKGKYVEIHFEDNHQNYRNWEIYIDKKVKESLSNENN